MSEFINNREMRQQVIKDIIRQLHDGVPVDEVKQKFEDTFQGVSASEISVAEAALISEGIPVEEIQKLCDVHAAVFKGTIEQIHQPTDPTRIPGHPLNIMVLENRQIENIIEYEIKPFLATIKEKKSYAELRKAVNRLSDLNIHYQKKENLLFPYMEKYGITAPPKVMWGVDDEIRAQIKEVKTFLINEIEDTDLLLKKIEAMLDRITEMIFKEENILIPMIHDQFTVDEWKVIAKESPEIGYLIDNIPEWKLQEEVTDIPTELNTTKKHKSEKGVVKLPSGEFKLDELVSMLNVLPFDITFVNKDDEVGYFSEGKERAFPRTRAIIGRNVSNCHPPASVHIVEKIVEDFKNGKKDHEDFWIQMGSKYILIRYYAVRNDNGDYLGVLEVTQDIKPIQEITGEKRLVSQ